MPSILAPPRILAIAKSGRSMAEGVAGLKKKPGPSEGDEYIGCLGVQKGPGPDCEHLAHGQSRTVAFRRGQGWGVKYCGIGCV